MRVDFVKNSIVSIMLFIFFSPHFAISRALQKLDTLQQNDIVKENQFKGTSEWKLTKPAVKREIEGYASSTSVAIGDSIQLFVNTTSSKFSYAIYRMGWYQGLGGRTISDPVFTEGTSQQIPKTEEQYGLIECHWKNPIKVVIEKNWTTGVYLVKLEEKDTQKQSYIIFVVRNDDSNSDILFQLPVTTYQAYNYWGGKSLYHWGSGDSLPWGSTEGDAAVKVSFDRPYALNTNLDVAHTVGSGEFFANFQPVSRGYPISSASWDYNMIRWLEKKGYDVSYSTNVDTQASLNELNNHKLFLSNGHDEYWSKQMRGHITKARDNGVNLAFFGANTMYWQIRFESNTTKTNPNRIVVCYKDVSLDTEKGNLCTERFREEPISNPESKLLGVQFFAEPVDGDLVVTNANHRLFKGTSLKNGDVLKGLLGYEVDGVTENSPKNVEILTSSKAIYNYKILGDISVKKKIKTLLLSIHYFWIILLNISSLLLLYIILKKIFKNSKFVVTLIMFVGLFVSILSVYKFREYNQRHISHMTIYAIENGAKVFSAGTIQWSWGLDDFGSPEMRTSRLNRDAEIITTNVLEMFGAKPNEKK